MSKDLKDKQYDQIKKDEEEKDRELFGEKILEQEHKDFEIEEQINPLEHL
ncbi:MAG: hypothetical protein RR942_02410 [Romboutsia sp.]